jgi:hemerythrin-like domain-containing protein
MSHPIHTLKHEHRVIEQGLRALEGICLRFSSGQQVPPEVLAQLLDFIQVFADRYHHGKEERILFPALQQQGLPREGSALGLILHQHEAERKMMADLMRDIEAYRAGIPDAYWPFVETSRQLIGTLTRHIEEEDQVLFKLAEEMLDETEKAALGAAFEQAEAELGADVPEKYEQIAVELERAWAV